MLAYWGGLTADQIARRARRAAGHGEEPHPARARAAARGTALAAWRSTPPSAASLQSNVVRPPSRRAHECPAGWGTASEPRPDGRAAVTHRRLVGRPTTEGGPRLRPNLDCACRAAPARSVRLYLRGGHAHGRVCRSPRAPHRPPRPRRWGSATAASTCGRAAARSCAAYPRPPVDRRAAGPAPWRAGSRSTRPHRRATGATSCATACASPDERAARVRVQRAARPAARPRAAERVPLRAMHPGTGPGLYGNRLGCGGRLGPARSASPTSRCRAARR